MGRAKLKMERMTNENKRNLAFKTKRATLIKRIHELTVLCDAKACIITCYSSKQPHIWPDNLDEARRLVDLYKKNKDETGRNKIYDLADFYKDKKRKVEQDLAKVRKEISGVKYPTWHDSLDKLAELDLRGFAMGLGEKAALVKSRIEQLKTSRTVERLGNGQGMELMHFGDPRIDWGLVNFQPNDMFVPPYGLYPMPCINGQNGMFGYQNLMNGTNGDEFGNVFMDPMNMGMGNQVGWFNGPPMLPQIPMPFPLQTYMQQQPPRQQQFPSQENYYGFQEDVFRY